MKTVRCFEEQVLRKRPYLLRDWIEATLMEPLARAEQSDGRMAAQDCDPEPDGLHCWTRRNNLMQVSVSDAKARLTDLVRRAEAGEDVVLTRRGQPAVRLVRAAPPRHDDDARWSMLEALQGSIRNRPGLEGVTAATIADFLYDERGLPA